MSELLLLRMKNLKTPEYLTLAETLSVSMAGSLADLPEEFLVALTRSVNALATSLAACNSMT